jgi:hypothetical protein
LSVRRVGEEGHALLLAVFVLFLLGMSLSLSVLEVQLRMRDQQRQLFRVRLDMMVDGVVAHTQAALAADPKSSGVPKRDLGAGQVWSEVEAAGNGQVRIEAWASLGPRVRGARLSATASGTRITAWARNSGVLAFD